MAANTSPIFSLTPKHTWGTLTTGTNTYDGTSGTTLICTAGADGAFVKEVHMASAGTNIATVVRFFINNGGTTGTAANNSFIYQQSLHSTTASATISTPGVIIPLNFVLPATFRIYAVLATTVAAGWQVTCISGDY